MTIEKATIDALVLLTEKREEHELNACLQEQVRALAQATSVKIYKVVRPDADHSRAALDVAAMTVRDLLGRVDSEMPLLELGEVGECVTKQQVVRLPAANGRAPQTVYPVMGPYSASGLVVVDGGRADAHSQDNILSLARVYANQLLMLNRNERDALTGLMNRHAFENRVPVTLHRLLAMDARRRAGDHQGSACLAILDVDHFKSVNDEFGHLIGDEVLLHLSQLMTRSFRHYDLLFRYGGEEFVIILLDVNLDVGMDVLERFRKTVAAYRFPRVGIRTVSIGVVEMNKHELPPVLLDRADKALYFGKSHGRNQVQAYERLCAEGKLSGTEAGAGDIELF